MFTVDAHCDSILQLYDLSLAQTRPPHHLDLAHLPNTGGLQWMACFPVIEGRHPYQLTCALLDKLNAVQAENKLTAITDKAGLEALRSEKDSWGVLRAIEGGEALDGDLSRLDEFFARGVRAIGLTWNHPNALSGGADTPGMGMTAFGRNVIGQMEKLGMVVDLAHISERGFWDAIDCVKKPPAVTHACCAELCPHRRNLSDAQIRALAERGGVVGVCLYQSFLGGEYCSIDTVTWHFLHLYRVGGRESVGLGSDFDGMDILPRGISDAHDVYKLWDALSKAGLPESDVELIAGGNWLRLLSECLT